MYGDGIINIIHKIVLKQQVTLISIEKETGVLTGILHTVAIVLAIAGIAVFIYFAGPALVATAIKLAVATSVVGFTVTTVAAGVAVGAVKYTLESFITKVEIPTYSISPEEIFENEIPLFDVNFFDPSDETVDVILNGLSPEIPANIELPDNIVDGINGEKDSTNVSKKLTSLGLNIEKYDWKDYELGPETTNTAEADTKVEKNRRYYVKDKGKKEEQGTYLYLHVRKGKVVNENGVEKVYWISTDQYHTLYKVDEIMIIPETEDHIESYSKVLHEVIQRWYYVLLSFAAVGMLSVLVYIGIRVLIASTAPEKAKYKEMIRDWLIGMILLFSMHYIMSFSNFFVDKFTDGIKAIKNKGTYVAMIQANDTMKGSIQNEGYKIIDVEGIDNEDFNNKSVEEQKRIIEESEDYEDLVSSFKDKKIYQVSDKSGYYWLIPTNLMGRLRVDLQTSMNESEGFIGYTVLFVMMVVYMIVFCLTYIKRVVYMAFLTMIAPLVALTYAIDKTNDGKAQGFDTWFKEYVFNLLLQPLHLVLYTILVTSAIELALDNPIYAIVCLGFMTPAEKILRKMFNFEKAQTPGLFGGAAGGALLFSGMRWLMQRGKENGKGRNGSEEGEDKGPLEKSGSGLKTANNLGVISSEGTQTNITSIGEASEESGEVETLQGQEGVINAQNAKGQGELSQDEESQGENPPEIKPSDIAVPNVKQPNEETKENADDRDRWTKIKGAAKGFGKAYWRRATGGASIKSMADVRRLAKSGAKIAAKTGMQMAGGVALGLTGLAAGASTGDFSKAAQYTGLGALGGAKLGGGLYNSMSRSKGMKDLIEETQRGYYGNEEYNKRQIEKMYEDAKKNKEYIAQYKKKMKVDWDKAQKDMADMIDWHKGNSNVKSFEKMMEIEKTTKELMKEYKYTTAEEEKKAKKAARTRSTITQQLIEETGLRAGTKKNDMDEMFKRLQVVHSDVDENILSNAFYRDSKIFFKSNQ